MGNNRPVKTKCWIKFLEENNCYKLRTTASHDLWKCSNCIRTITFREKDKEIPAMHLRTNLKTMSKTLEELYKWVDENC